MANTSPRMLSTDTPIPEPSDLRIKIYKSIKTNPHVNFNIKNNKMNQKEASFSMNPRNSGFSNQNRDRHPPKRSERGERSEGNGELGGAHGDGRGGGGVGGGATERNGAILPMALLGSPSQNRVRPRHLSARLSDSRAKARSSCASASPYIGTPLVMLKL